MRLSSELRDRSKAFASGVIGVFVALPKEREEVHILAKQMIRAGTCGCPRTGGVAGEVRR
jgi:hypothetical protein